MSTIAFTPRNMNNGPSAPNSCRYKADSKIFRHYRCPVEGILRSILVDPAGFFLVRKLRSYMSCSWNHCVRKKRGYSEEIWDVAFMDDNKCGRVRKHLRESSGEAYVSGKVFAALKTRKFALFVDGEWGSKRFRMKVQHKSPVL